MKHLTDKTLQYLKENGKNILIKAALTAALGLLLSFICGKFLYSDTSDILEFAVLISCIAGVLGIVFGKLSVGIILTYVPTAILGIISYYKMKISGTPLSFADFSLFKEAASIVSMNITAITFNVKAVLIGAAAILSVVIAVFIGKKMESLKTSIKAKVISVCCFVLVFVIIQPFEGCYGSLLNIWCDAMPEIILPGSDSEIEKLIASVPDEETDTDKEKPNVIVILSESFFDVTQLDGVEYDEDPVEDFHRLQKESVSGKFYTRTMGYGTCSIEMEILTGINTCYLGKDQYISEWDLEKLAKNDSVPELFRQAGYSTVYLHSFNDSIYNRSRILPTLGFDSMYFSGDFNDLIYSGLDLSTDEYYEALADDYLETDYYSDMLIADAAEKLTETTDEPLFCFGATVGNHTPFEAGKYDEYDFSFTADISDEAKDSLNALTQGVANASEMLGKLTDYFRGCDEPTVIVFFGDHKPNITGEGDSTVYEELGIAGNSVYSWDLDQTQTMLSTDYLIWSNDSSYLPDEPGTEKDLSSNFLGLDILSLGNVPLTDEWKLLKAARTHFQCWNSLYIIDGNGTFESVGDYIADKDEYNLLKQIKSYYIKKYS